MQGARINLRLKRRVEKEHCMLFFLLENKSKRISNQMFNAHIYKKMRYEFNDVQ